MGSLDEKQKRKLIEYFEYVLKPINGKFISLDEPMIMYSTISEIGDHRNIMSEENKILIYHMNFTTNFTEISMSLYSDYLEDLKGAVSISCTNCSLLRTLIPKEKLQEINMRVFELHKIKDLI